MIEKTAIVIGATGLVGSHLVRLLVKDDTYKRIRIFTRRSTGIKNPKIEEYIVDFENIDDWKHEIIGDVLFSSLGTTIRQAGSKKAQYKIDFTYQYEIAKAASENGVEQFLLVSSLGANPKSSIFYSRMKGELDEAVHKLQFKKIFIIQPSALVGQRKTERIGEKIMIKITAAIVSVIPLLKKYKPINANTVALAMINLAAQPKKYQEDIIENNKLFHIAESK